MAGTVDYNYSSAQIVWPSWNQTYTVTTGAGATTYYDPWPYWTTTATSTGAATVNTISAITWTDWNQNYTTTTNVYTTNANVWPNWAAQHADALAALERGAVQQPVQVDPEVVQAQLRRAEEIRAQQQAAYEARIRELEKAKDRAEKLLREFLDEKQREELSAKGYFTLESIRPNGERKRYQIARGRSHNVREVDANGKVIATLCAHPVAAVPDQDTMLAQALMLKHDEPAFLKMANRAARVG